MNHRNSTNFGKFFPKLWSLTSALVYMTPAETLLNIIAFVDHHSIFDIRLVCRRFESVIHSSKKLLPLLYRLYR